MARERTHHNCLPQSSAARVVRRMLSAHWLPSGRLPNVVVDVTTGGPSVRGAGAGAGVGAEAGALPAAINAQRLRPVFSISPISFIRCKVDCSVGMGLADCGAASFFSRNARISVAVNRVALLTQELAHLYR